MIVFIGHDAYRTGAPMSLLRIIQCVVAQKGQKCLVVLGRSGPLIKDYKMYADVYVWSGGCIGNRWTRKIYSLFTRILKPSLDFDRWRGKRFTKKLASIGVGCIFNNTGVNGEIVEVLKSYTGAPVISRIPELEAYMRKNNINGSANKVLKLTDHFIAVSEAVKANLINRHNVPADRVSVVYGSVAADRKKMGEIHLRDSLGLPDNAFIVGGCGTLDWRKGIDQFIQIANLAHRTQPQNEIFFVWIGRCVSDKACIEYNYEIELLGLDNYLFLIGEVDDTAPYLAELDLFLLTSREDPFPLVMLEAARQGKPIICFSGSGGAVEFVDESVGAVVPMLDTHSMLDAILRLKNDTSARLSIGNKAFERSLEYSPEKMGRAVLDIIQKLSETQ